MSEIEHVYRAVEITELAHESAVQAIKNGALEAEVQASLDFRAQPLNSELDKRLQKQNALIIERKTSKVNSAINFQL